MINKLQHLNWISVLVAFGAYFFLGAMWFTALFKRPYAVSLGKENNLPAKPAPIFIVGPMICSLVITVASALLIYALQLSSVISALEFAAVVGLGFLVANTVNIAINPNIPRPILYGIISGAYHLVGIVIVSVIIVAMK